MKPPDASPFEELEHTADLRMRVRGRSMEELFVHAAQGMLSLMHYCLGANAQPVVHEVHLTSYDAETLLVDWLGELLYLSERGGLLWESFEILHLDVPALVARVSGYGPAHAERVIKAVTFSDLTIGRDALGNHVATVTFDV